MMRQRLPCLLGGALALSFLICSPDAGAQEAKPDDAAAPKYDPTQDEKTLKEAELSATGPGLLAYFKNQLLAKADANKVDTLIQQLGSSSFDERQSASAQLKDIGNPVKPFVTKAIDSADPEIARRAREVLAGIQLRASSTIISAAIRLLAHRRPQGALDVLIEHASLTEEEDNNALEARREAFLALAGEENKPNPEVVKALKSAKPRARALLAEALVRSKAVGLAEAKQHFRDDSALVRFRVAMALTEREVKEAVPILIRELAEVPLEHAWEAESILYQLAKDNAPEVSLSEEKASRIASQKAWQTWWKDNAATVDLAELTKQARLLGHTLIAMRDNRSQGIVAEYDRAGKELWQISGLSYPMDVQRVSNGNVLIAERNSSRVTERTTTGKIVWTYNVTQATGCYRMRNGKTMIAGNTELVLLGRDKKVEMRYRSRQGSIYSARPTSRGGYVLLTSTGRLVWIDAKGTEQRTIAVGGSVSYYSSIDALPNGNVLVPLYNNNRVVEFDAQGKVVKTFTGFSRPTSAQRLSNGRTLVGAYSSRAYYELSPTGKILKTTSVPGYLWHTSRR